MIAFLFAIFLLIGGGSLTSGVIDTGNTVSIETGSTVDVGNDVSTSGPFGPTDAPLCAETIGDNSMATSGAVDVGNTPTCGTCVAPEKVGDDSLATSGTVDVGNAC